jgi:hypothetical protein
MSGVGVDDLVELMRPTNAEIEKRERTPAVEESAREDGLHLVPPPSSPLAVARAFVSTRYAHDLGARLVAHRGLFYEWHGTHWVEVAGGDMRAQLYAWLEHALYLDPKGSPVPFEPNRYKVANVIDALAGAEHVAVRP